MAEKSGLGVAEILLHVLCAAISLGVLISSAVTVSTVNDVFEDAPEGDPEDDGNRYRAVAGFLLFVGIAGIITQVIFAIVRALFYGEVISSSFYTVFGIICIICSVLLVLALLAGGIASAANAADFQNEYIDPVSEICDQAESLGPDFEDACNDLFRIRNSQAAAAALSLLGVVLCGVTTVLVGVSMSTNRAS